MPEATMNTGTAVPPTRRTSGLVLWLVCGLAVASLYAWVNLSGIGRLGLGWAIKPGFVVLFVIVALAAMELLTVRVMKVIQVVLCLLAALFLEYLSLPRPLDSFVGIALTLLGLSVMFNSAQKIRVPEALLLMVGAYMQSVFIYNLFRGEQMMFFFKPGWTV